MADLTTMPKETPLSWLEEALRELDRQGLRRRVTTADGRRPGSICLDGIWLNDFSGNDYLGLSHHPRCLKAAGLGLQWGCGAGGSRIVTGGGPAQGDLEQSLATLYGAHCVIFPSGYQANLGMLSALCQPGDTIYSDAHNHASIVDGCRLSGARIRVYPHRQWEVLESWLTEKGPGRHWIVTDTVFSMDGGLAPLGELKRLSEAHGAPLLVDEAHAMGVLGPQGRGLCAHLGIQPDVLMGTFSKGLGGHGAFTMSSRNVAHWLLNRARPFIYTTALPPAVLSANREAVHLATGDCGQRRRQKVLHLASNLRKQLRSMGLEPSGEGTPIVSLSFKEQRATDAQSHLRERGHLCWAFRPPTVEPGTSRLRISLSASHEPAQVEDLAQALAQTP